MKVLWIDCPCGRNVAKVHLGSFNPPGVTDGLWVEAATNGAEREDYRPNNSLVSGITYTWGCRNSRCPLTHARRHERISAAWAANIDDTRKNVHVVLDADL